MSMLSAAALLDELMGADRNLAPDQKGKSTHWSDSEVCRHFLCGFCPSELFVNTRSDLGPCDKLHDEKLKTAYEQSSRRGNMGYEDEFLRYLQNIMTDMERRIRRGHARLVPKDREGAANRPDSEKENMLSEKINALVQQVEQLGCEGKVEEAQGVMKLIDQLKEDREQLKGPSREMSGMMSSQEKQMEVCEVCGAFLIVGDAQTRVDDHLMGKQHMGYAKIKSTLEELKSRPWRKQKSPDDSTDVDQEQQEKIELDVDTRRDRDRDRRGRDHDRDRRDRDRDRDRRGRDRDRDRDRGRDRRRSDRDRDSDRDRRRERNRDRDSRDASQEREGEKEGSVGNEKDKSRRSRSRSRDRSSRDREGSRDKRRSKSPRRSRSPR